MRWASGPAAGGKINRTMYLTPEELKSHMYAHIVEEITEGDEQIVLQAIEAAVEEVRSYLRPRYDTDRIFAAEGSERNALVLENTKIVTVWNLIAVERRNHIRDMEGALRPCYQIPGGRGRRDAHPESAAADRRERRSSD